MKNSPYAETYARSISDKAGFWHEQAQRIAWHRAPKTALTPQSDGTATWFPDGELNMSYLCLDWHVQQGRGQQTALIYDSPVTGQVLHYSYAELLEEVGVMAGVFQQNGLQAGDTVIIYMPMIPQAVMAMLACARLGAIHSVVFGGFAPHELAIRINDAKPKMVVSASYGIEVSTKIDYKPLLDAALKEAAHQPERVFIWQRQGAPAVLQAGRDYDLALAMRNAQPAAAVVVPSDHPLYILYTSGTTGKPKGIVRDTGGYAVALHYSMEAVYNMRPGEVFWAASDVGWVVGHSYIVYAPLLFGCTTLLYEGKPVKTPDAAAFWRVIEQHQVKVLFTAPTAIRAIKKEDPAGELLHKHDLSSLRCLYLAGERCDPNTLEWSAEKLQRPVVDHWWQTESGWPMVANPMGIEALTVKPGSASVPVPGYEIQILSEEGRPLIAGQEGLVAVKLPLPPGCLPTLWQDAERFRESYLSTFPGYYMTGDGGFMDEENYVYIMGRVDDVINVSGHRLSTGEMEGLLAEHPLVAESAVIGIADALRGQVPIALVVVKDGGEVDPVALEIELIALIREKIGAVAVFKAALLVKRLPKTRSGKILRKTMRMIADGLHYTVPSTIDDPAILTEIHDALAARKIGQAFLPHHIVS
ncbi:MAG: AMP-binding protein [Sphingobacteriaceae bacterium]|nr:AMP-binding protein [Sphingobacteriaceae bacterium]